MKRPLYNAIHSLLFNQKHFVAAILIRVGWWIPDELYLRWVYYLGTGNKLNLDSPQRYNEKLQWLKLNYHNPLWTKMVDKYAVKEYVKGLMRDYPDEHLYVAETLGVWKCPKDIEWDSLPNQFVLKTNHDGGNNGVFVCKDKAKVDKKKLIRAIDKSLKRDVFALGREWPYKNVKRCVFAEQYLEDSSGELRDYKFFCFNGKAKYLFIATERQSGGEVKFNYYDEDFKPLDIIQHHPMSSKLIDKPQKFVQMKQIASHLSQGLPEVRVDFYEVNGKIYFGEYTFFHHGGTVPFHPDKWDLIWGNLIQLPSKLV